MANQQTTEDRIAENKYSRYRKTDPFPEIPPALLNSGDIEDYVNTTGMISPFYKKNLKSASYAAGIKGTCLFWDENGDERTVELTKEHETFTLKPNSIAFIEVEPKFRLPNYIALRFNLKITNVYRGLLLGTGPLVDPGYEGKLYIPLHNLTTNSYVFEYGEPLIWIEFTKTSKIRDVPIYSGSTISRNGAYVNFRDDKKNQPLKYFLKKASKGGVISSSLHDIKHGVDEFYKSVNSRINDVNTKIRKWSIAGIAALILAVVGLIVGLIYPGWQLQYSVSNELSHVQSTVVAQKYRVEQNTSRIGDLNTHKSSLEIIVAEQKMQIRKLQRQVANLNLKVSEYSKPSKSSSRQ